MKLKLTVFLVLFTLMLSCTEENSDESRAVDSFVDDKLYEYFESFKQEAELRSVDINFELLNVEGYIDDIQDRGVAGQCQTYVNGNRAVVMDESYWNKSSDLVREFLVFHELGHCVLGREHLDTESANGNCNSIMHSGSSGCDLDYTARTRDDFLDELFTNL